MKYLLLIVMNLTIMINLNASPSPVHSDAVSNFIAGTYLSDNYLMQTFRQCFPNTLKTTITLEGDGTTYIITGDINAMWMRDSCAQINPYIYLCLNDNNLKRVISGTILRHIKHINTQDPFINSFNEDYSVYEYKYEPDGVAYFIRLCWLYWKVSGDTSWNSGTGQFDCHNAFNRILNKIISEQTNNPPYTGMVYCLFRPSDDNCVYNYHVPDNMFLAAMVPKLKEMYQTFFPTDTTNINLCQSIHDTIISGITNYGIFNDPVYGNIWAYEVDGNGHYLLIDDANTPSLLSAPYIGFCSNNNPIYQNTRKFVLSTSDPYYYSGSFANGIGSYHTAQVNPGRVWPMSIMMQAITSDDNQEITTLLDYLNCLDAGTHYMHEGVYVNDPSQYSRSWFAWANTFFGELIMRKVLGLNFFPGDGVYARPMANNKLQMMSMTNSVSFISNNVMIRISGSGPDILSGTVNGIPSAVDQNKGIKVTLSPADIRIQMRTNVFIQKSINIKKFFNRDGISWDTNKLNGSISGTGNTSYDADYIPDIFYSSFSGLKYVTGSKTDGQSNVISTSSQNIPLTNVKVADIYILAVGINGPQTGTFRIWYKDNSYDDIQKNFSDWSSDPIYGEPSAVVMGHRHDSGNEQVIKCHVYEYTLYPNFNKTISSITLPANQNIIILAMDLNNFNTNQSYVIPTNKIPKFVTGLKLSPGLPSPVLSWNPVIRNSDNSLIDNSSRILFYRVYKSSDLNSFTNFIETTNTFCNISPNDFGYYEVTALNASYIEGGVRAAISSGSNLIAMSRNTQDNSLLVKIIIPPSVYRTFYKGNNSYNDDLYFNVSSLNSDTVSLFNYEINVLEYSTDVKLSELKFPVNLSSIFYYKVDPVSGYIMNTTIPASEAASLIRVYKYNGIEYIYDEGVVDPSSDSVEANIDSTGKYSIRSKNSATVDFNLLQIEPTKIFTPAGVDPHNEIKFYFENPQVKQADCKIFTIKGEFVRNLPMSMNGLTDGYFYWDGKDEKGKDRTSGVYIYQLECNGKVINGTIILAR